MSNDRFPNIFSLLGLVDSLIGMVFAMLMGLGLVFGVVFLFGLVASIFF